jgi:hypothetical protein
MARVQSRVAGMGGRIGMLESMAPAVPACERPLVQQAAGLAQPDEGAGLPGQIEKIRLEILFQPTLCENILPLQACLP